MKRILSLIVGFSTLVGILTMPISSARTQTIYTYLVTVTPASSTHRADTLKFSFDARAFYETQFRVVADSIPFDSATVYFCTSTTGLWTGGKVAAFDRDPSTAALDGWKISGAAAGTFVPPRNIVLAPIDIYGNPLIGRYIMGYITLTAKTHRIKNLSIIADCRK